MKPDPNGPLTAPASALWRRGLELGLWRFRSDAMPLWRRGARGLEFWSLCKLCESVDALQGDAGARGHVESLLEPVWREGPLVLEAQAARLADGGKTVRNIEGEMVRGKAQGTG